MSDPRITTSQRPSLIPPRPAAPIAAPVMQQRPGGDSLSLSPAVRAEVTDRDVTLGADLDDKTRIVARQVTASPTMMNGASLLKVERDLGSHTTAFVGVAHLPGFYRRSIGPNERVNAPQTAAFIGVEDFRGTRKPLGQGVNLDLSLQTVAVATASYGHAEGALDVSTSAGLSKLTSTAEATLSKKIGAVDASLGYGHHLDGGQIGTYYVSGGKGVAPRTHWVQAGLGTQVGGASARLDAYVPIETASNEFSDQAKVRASVGDMRVLPDMGVTVTRNGVERIDATKFVPIGREWDAAASVTAYRPTSDRPELVAGVGLRWTPGGHKSSRPATRPQPDWRNQAPTRRSNTPDRVEQPRLATWFSAAQIAEMKGKPVAELAKVLRTPEQVVAYLAEFVTYDDARSTNSHGDNGSLRPDEVASLLKGVCRDQHPFVLSVMKEGQQIEGRAIGYMSPGTSHAIAVYRDPTSNKWNVVEYGRIHHTEAATPEEAFEAVRPDALVYGDWSQGGPGDKNVQRTIRYSATAREYYQFVQPSKN